MLTGLPEVQRRGPVSRDTGPLLYKAFLLHKAFTHQRLPPMIDDLDALRRAGYRAVDLVVEHLAGLRERPVAVPLTAEERTALRSEPFPEEGSDLEDIIQDVAERIAPRPMGNNHPRFFGWVNSPATPASIIAAMLAAALNPSVAGGDHAAVYIEHAVIDWMKELLDYPRSAMGVLTSGGSSANLIGLAVARNSTLARLGHDVRRAGLRAAPPIRLYMSAEIHSSMSKAIEILGIGNDAVRFIPTDSTTFQLDHHALAATMRDDRLRDGSVKGAAIVLASAGTVNCGAVDPLNEIADICQAEEAWLHLDGAYGAPGILADDRRDIFAGMERADSLSIDPHKWLYVAIDCGCVLVRDGEALRNTFSLVPPYLHDASGAPPWFSEYTFEQTRSFRALKLWAAMRERGRSGYRASITRDIALARRLADAVTSSDDFELVAPVSLSIVAFRYAPQHLQNNPEALDRINAALPLQLQQRGDIFLTGTRLGGRPVLRVCFVNFRTTENDVDVILSTIRDCIISN